MDNVANSDYEFSRYNHDWFMFFSYKIIHHINLLSESFLHIGTLHLLQYRIKNTLKCYLLVLISVALYYY